MNGCSKNKYVIASFLFSFPPLDDRAMGMEKKKSIEGIEMINLILPQCYYLALFILPVLCMSAQGQTTGTAAEL